MEGRRRVICLGEGAVAVQAECQALSAALGLRPSKALLVSDSLPVDGQPTVSSELASGAARRPVVDKSLTGTTSQTSSVRSASIAERNLAVQFRTPGLSLLRDPHSSGATADENALYDAFRSHLESNSSVSTFTSPTSILVDCSSAAALWGYVQTLAYFEEELPGVPIHTWLLRPAYGSFGVTSYAATQVTALALEASSAVVSRGVDEYCEEFTGASGGAAAGSGAAPTGTTNTTTGGASGSNGVTLEEAYARIACDMLFGVGPLDSGDVSGVSIAPEVSAATLWPSHVIGADGRRVVDVRSSLFRTLTTLRKAHGPSPHCLRWPQVSYWASATGVSRLATGSGVRRTPEIHSVRILGSNVRQLHCSYSALYPQLLDVFCPGGGLQSLTETRLNSSQSRSARIVEPMVASVAHWQVSARHQAVCFVDQLSKVESDGLPILRWAMPGVPLRGYYDLISGSSGVKKDSAVGERISIRSSRQSVISAAVDDDRSVVSSHSHRPSSAASIRSTTSINTGSKIPSASRGESFSAGSASGPVSYENLRCAVAAFQSPYGQCDLFQRASLTEAALCKGAYVHSMDTTFIEETADAALLIRDYLSADWNFGKT